MPLEIEAKLKLDDPSALRERLTCAGAACTGRKTLRDHYFDTPDHRLRDADCGLRLRVGDGAVLSYKGPRTGGPFKCRQELETAVADGAALTQLLVSLGFVEVFVYEKRREVWLLTPCVVSMDELPRLGHFVEVEGPTEAAVAETLRRLGLEDRPVLPASYVHMVAEHIERHEPNGHTLLFPEGLIHE